MSSTNCVHLTEEQQEFLNSLEEEFKDRYTDKDEEFKAALNEELPLPPLVENWRDFRQPDERFGNDRNYRHRGRVHGDYGHSRRSDRYHACDYDRHSHSSRHFHSARDRNDSHNTYATY